MEYSLRVGARFNAEERESVLAVWRYADYLMGIPETILYTTGAAAENIYKISYLCEPLPDADSITVANGLIQAIPSVADVADPVEEKKLMDLAYRLSRALIGNQLSNRFDFPKHSTIGTLFSYRMKQRIKRMLRGGQLVSADNFAQLMTISVYDKRGLSYKMLDHVKHSKSSPWLSRHFEVSLQTSLTRQIQSYEPGDKRRGPRAREGPFVRGNKSYTSSSLETSRSDHPPCLTLRIGPIFPISVVGFGRAAARRHLTAANQPLDHQRVNDGFTAPSS